MKVGWWRRRVHFAYLEGLSLGLGIFANTAAISFFSSYVFHMSYRPIMVLAISRICNTHGTVHPSNEQLPS